MPDIGSIDLRDITLQSGLKSLSKGNASETPNISESADSFASVLKKSILEVDAAQKNSDIAVSELVAGDKKNVHETMISLEKADISFRLMMKVRNKILDAYKEVLRMNI